MIQHRLTRRAAALLAGALLGLSGVAGLATPAAATTTTAAADLVAECGWDSSATEWVVGWTVTTPAPDGATAFRVIELTTGEEAGAVEGIAVTDPVDGFPYLAGEPLTATQRFPGTTATSTSLAVLIEWDTGQTDQAVGEISIPDECAAPDSQAEIRQWSYTCAELAVTIDNSAGQDVTLRFVPTVGDPADVGVAGGEVPTVSFPATDGLTVDVQFQGQSIVDPADPIEITSESWAELSCATGGGGGDLPATGRPIGIFAIGAVLLLVAGGSLYLIARRRRITFTA